MPARGPSCGVTGTAPPLLTIRAGRPALLVTLTVPERIEPGHVEFARALATSATAYAAEVERRFRRLTTPKEVAA